MSEYARALGRGRAERLAASLGTRPSVTVFSKQRLFVSGAGVVETRLPQGDAAFAFSYSGLRLLIRSGGKYFLLPEEWSRRGGVAIVVADTADLRLEFGPGR
jgi:hypothetical protein